MRVHKGRSALEDGRAAVLEASEGFPHDLDLLLVFSSTRQDAEEVAAGIRERFPGVPVAGCSTAGEHLDGVHSRDSLVLAGLEASGYAWGAATLSLDGFDQARAEDGVAALLAETSTDLEHVEPETCVCLMFIDGLRAVEESVTALIAEALGGVRLAGGSAGDDLKFAQTHVFGPDGAQTNAVTVLFARSLDGTPVRILKHQHFAQSPRPLAVTAVEGRRILEFDGYPAVEAYANALGLPPEKVDAGVAFAHPLTFLCAGELYVRSIQSVNDDGSISFYCAVEEGMVLDVAAANDMTEALEADLTSWSTQPEFVVGFNCILRALEATDRGLHDQQGQLMRQACGGSIGFDTYGEQLYGLHINQTLVAVGFGRDVA